MTARELARLKVGLIGYGLAGRYLHAPLIAAAGLPIVGIVTKRAAQARGDYPDAEIFPSAAALCAQDIDLAVVATPDHRHVADARAALEAGKHVVIDKPVAPTAAEALALIDEARARGLMLTVFHNRRWDNDFLTVQKLIAEGALGEIVHYAARWDRFRPDATGGWREEHMNGELYGLGAHLVDQALVLFGPPDWIFADVYKQRAAPGLGDGFELLMGKGRLRMTLAVNLLAADELRSVRVLGTRAAFAKTGLDPQEQHLRAGRPVADPAFGVEAPEAAGLLTEGVTREGRVIASRRGDWTQFYRGVHAALGAGAPAPVAPGDAAIGVAILEAALTSARTGRRIDFGQKLEQMRLGRADRSAWERTAAPQFG